MASAIQRHRYRFSSGAGLSEPNRFGTRRRRPRAASVEGLEPRLVLSGYVVSDVAGFDPPPAGYDPRSSLVRDSAGNLFGTTYSGGAYDKGTVFEIATGSTAVTTLASFSGANGSSPTGGVSMD